MYSDVIILMFVCKNIITEKMPESSVQPMQILLLLFNTSTYVCHKMTYIIFNKCKYILQMLQYILYLHLEPVSDFL